MKLLNITNEERIGCAVTYNLNRFEVYSQFGAMLTAANTKSDLKQQLKDNNITGAKFDASATRMYMKS